MMAAGRHRSKPRSRQSDINLDVYAEESVAREYGQPGQVLFHGERTVLDRISPSITGKSVLDIGVGGGRTTAPLLKLTDDYLGIDFSPAMIAACKARFPAVEFRLCDVRDLSVLGPKIYDFIWFSWNGIDSLDGGERQTALQQVFAKLKPGGLYFFATHNRLAKRERPWDLSLYVYRWRWNASDPVKSSTLLARSCWNYLRYRHLQKETDRYSIRVDSGHDFGCVHYYADPIEQVRQLQAIGFADIQIMTGGGARQTPDSESLRRAVHLLFLARRPDG